MTFIHFKPRYQKFLLFVFACILPGVVNCNTEELISEKRIGVAMRMIGHEVLLCLGDSDSRIMPIEKIDEHYKIPFEFEFGFDPDDMISIVDDVIKKTKIATNYLVEVEQCETKKVVHSFEMGNTAYSDLNVCGGRKLPKDCYNILITILDGRNPTPKLAAKTSDSLSNNLSPSSEELSYHNSSLIDSEIKESNLFKSVFLVIPFLFLFGFIGYFMKRKNPADLDPNLILIGASQFDKRNMTLSFENKKIELSNKEAELLSLLHAYVNAPIEREAILNRVWGDEGDYVGRTLDVFISKLRKKLEADASVKIVNIRGIGYKLVMDAMR